MLPVIPVFSLILMMPVFLVMPVFPVSCEIVMMPVIISDTLASVSEYQPVFQVMPVFLMITVFAVMSISGNASDTMQCFQCCPRQCGSSFS